MEKTIKIQSNEEAVALYGTLDEHLKYAEKQFGVRIAARNHMLTISGNQESVENAYDFFHGRLQQIKGNKTPLKGEKVEAIKSEREAESGKSSAVTFYHRGKLIAARSKNQEKYLDAIRNHDVVFGIGPAGTGKTYLAMAAAIEYLKKKMVSRIILTRPAVEAGESLGFLPGDFQAKVNPYLRPLYDALHDMMDFEEATRFMERGLIEVAPIAYMRGRTLADAFVVLDEAQNCTHSQMKMFLTRLGQNSKMIVAGDITQIDLPTGKKSGLIEAQSVLTGVRGVQVVVFDESDVVRHPLVQQIVIAYDKYERKHALGHHHA